MGDSERINGWWTAQEAVEQHPDLVGAKLIWQTYHRPSENWDHDHCALCWEKITDNPTRDGLREAFTDGVLQHGSPATDDPNLIPAPAARQNWVCATCAVDYQESFGWTATGGPPSGE
jgi:hypothetical protein